LAESTAAAVPHRGQCCQLGSRGASQEAHVVAGAGVVEGPTALAGSSSAVSDTPFLNSFMDLPIDPASSGSFYAPKRTSTMTRPTIRSWLPSIAFPPALLTTCPRADPTGASLTSLLPCRPSAIPRWRACAILATSPAYRSPRLHVVPPCDDRTERGPGDLGHDPRVDLGFPIIGRRHDPEFRE
jgi:hypothetical protein